jgi:hypothetical protein
MESSFGQRGSASSESTATAHLGFRVATSADRSSWSAFLPHFPIEGSVGHLSIEREAVKCACGTFNRLAFTGDNDGMFFQSARLGV